MLLQQGNHVPVTVTVDTILVRDSEPIPTTVDNEVVVLSVRAGACFGFNAVGSEIWDMLGEPCPVGRIFDRLSQTHEVDADTMTRDVTRFLQALIERRLVRVVDPGKAR
jgi:Coenzyme PQQ synthesis protein D (PqqD)